MGLTFSKHKNDGNSKLISAFTKALMSVGGFDYVPENLRSLAFIEAAKNIKRTHYARNNFYNEPAAVNKLDKMGTKIPKPAIKECIGGTLMVLLGNFYGRSFDAIVPATKVLKNFLRMIGFIILNNAYRMTKKSFRKLLQEICVQNVGVILLKNLNSIL